jgi:predicted N-acetyltransferase YhbS
VSKELKFRKMELKDIPAIIAIVKQNYPDSDWHRNLAEELALPFFNSETVRDVFGHVFVCCRDEEILGFGLYNVSSADNHVYELSLINVAPEHQEKGIGTQLVRFLLEELSSRTGDLECNLVILTAKDRLTDFYERFGFRIHQANALHGECFMTMRYERKK